ncbi:MAG: tRNA pseudouridine synthase A, partial [Lachnospiraceae bacterium]|nr:tRNA pseudouridine synthase A [Lachnospiraceae bacterium]
MRVLLRVAYDGTNYHGWQRQENAVSVESVLTAELQRLLKEDIELTGASRTDAGVHAMGNVAVFDTETTIPAEKICFAVNQSLPPDIRVIESREVPADFHPRYTECIKTYEYVISNEKIYNPLTR